MAYYYNYTIGYEHDGKIYPFGPYDAKGKIMDVVSRSKSFASDLYEWFHPVKDSQISDELRKQFERKNWNGDAVVDVKYLPLTDLPSGSYIKKGYFLIDDVKRYQEGECLEDIFYDRLSPEVYSAMLQNECMGLKPAPRKDCEGEEIEVHSASEYMYFAYPDYHCREYEAFLIKFAASFLSDHHCDLDAGDSLVVLETQG